MQVALTSTVLIEQAKGVLMERHGADEQAAFTSCGGSLDRPAAD